MIQALALLSLVMLMFAAAAQLWSSGMAREQQRRSLTRMEQSLGGMPHAPPLPGALPGQPQPSSGLPTDDLCLRAGLPPGLRMPLTVAVVGVTLALLATWRIGTGWAFPVMLALYAVLVWLWLRARIEKQQKQILRQLPDFLDGMVRLASIGNSLPMAFQVTTNSVQMPLRAVLDRAMSSVRAGHDLDRALQLAARPYRLHALELLHVVLGTGMRMGGRADQILQRMSDFMRDLEQAQQELRAITSETRMSAWVLGLLPVITATFMTLTNPTFFNPMFHQPLGHTILLIALGLELLGSFLLYRLAKSL
ncbi:type II secretion system F family protein [Rhodanobacter sp. DHG33]|uniref:type II secretion system F family protein n=1 Tax=Rhodanobacter sp. DHG33 TaxID=2775921 RepID=UPI0017847C8E|nr:type II secretion system F family protein [Rhodanobacter sp. DHG33]MBD8898942.1 type II secretion system F family protein [Rhodanobacter sp. DHG33]